jgi:protein SCO1/2
MAEQFAHQETPLREFWPAPEFAFPDHRKNTVSRESLLGTPWVANFVFTTCRSVCPMLTTKMVQLQRKVPGLPVKFVSFSVDPDNDTEDVLAAYAQKWNPEEPRWHLLRTTESGVESLARGFRITAQKADGGPDRVYHSQVFVLVDARGVVRGIYDFEDARDFQSLERALRDLTASPAPIARADRTGPQMYSQLSCANCHEHPELAPALGGLAGQDRELENALIVKADDAYLRESILSPDAKRLKGYPLRMPSYSGHLTYGELDALVAHLKTLPATPTATDAQVKTDPICQMDVRATPDALREGEVYFCSAHCRDEYVRRGKRPPR